MIDVNDRYDAKGAQLILQPEAFDQWAFTTDFWAPDGFKAGGFAQVQRNPSFLFNVTLVPGRQPLRRHLRRPGRGDRQAPQAGQLGAVDRRWRWIGQNPDAGFVAVAPWIVARSRRPRPGGAARTRWSRSGVPLLPELRRRRAIRRSARARARTAIASRSSARPRRCPRPARCRRPRHAGAASADGLRHAPRSSTAGGRRAAPPARRRRRRSRLRRLAGHAAPASSTIYLGRQRRRRRRLHAAGASATTPRRRRRRAAARRRLRARRRRRVYVAWQELCTARRRRLRPHQAGALRRRRRQARRRRARRPRRRRGRQVERRRSPSTARGNPLVAWVDERDRSARRPAARAHLLRPQPRRRRDVRAATCASTAAAPTRFAAELDNKWAPAIAVRPLVHPVAWTDFRNYQWDIYTARSRDGRYFERNVRVDDGVSRAHPRPSGDRRRPPRHRCTSSGPTASARIPTPTSATPAAPRRPPLRRQHAEIDCRTRHAEQPVAPGAGRRRRRRRRRLAGQSPRRQRHLLRPQPRPRRHLRRPTSASTTAAPTPASSTAPTSPSTPSTRAAYAVWEDERLGPAAIALAKQPLH